MVAKNGNLEDETRPKSVPARRARDLEVAAPPFSNWTCLTEQTYLSITEIPTQSNSQVVSL